MRHASREHPKRDLVKTNLVFGKVLENLELSRQSLLITTKFRLAHKNLMSLPMVLTENSGLPSDVGSAHVAFTRVG